MVELGLGTCSERGVLNELGQDWVHDSLLRVIASPPPKTRPAGILCLAATVSKSRDLACFCAGRCLVSFCGGGAVVLRNEGEMLVRPVLVERSVEVASGVGAGVAATGVG